MTDQYLRVKNWADFQHYDSRKRRPPWIKFYNDLLGGDDGFALLTETEQWQLVRIWLVASKSSALARDESGKVVQVIVYDEKSLRRSIMSLKRIPLEKFIREGWLIPVAGDGVIPADDASAGASASASTDASADASAGASTLLEVEGRGVENFAPKDKGSPRSPARLTGLPVNDHLLDRLLTLCASSADEGTERVFRSYAKRLPESSLAKVVETTAKQPAADRAKYANGALKSEIEERRVA